MSEGFYRTWRAETVRDYAADKVRVGAMAPETALAESDAVVAGLLADGVATPGHLLYMVTDDDGVAAGALWCALREGGEAFVYDIRIDRAHRRRGLASAALHALEETLRPMGVRRIGLHVFGDNEAALALYRNLGYRVSDVMMAKEIGPAGRDGAGRPA